MTTKLQVVFYSMYGHVYRMAEAIAEGARSVDGCEVQLLQVPELMPDEALEKSGAKAARAAFAHIPVAEPAQLAEADGIIFGTPTRFGNMAAQMRNFLDQTGGLWVQGGAGGQGGQRLCQYRHPAWRSGDHHHQLSQYLVSPRHGGGRGALQRTTLGDHG